MGLHWDYQQHARNTAGDLRTAPFQRPLSFLAFLSHCHLNTFGDADPSELDGLLLSIDVLAFILTEGCPLTFAFLAEVASRGWNLS